MHSRLVFGIICGVTVAGVSFAARAANYVYTVLDLQGVPQDGAASSAPFINDNGVVAGSLLTSPTSASFFYRLADGTISIPKKPSLVSLHVWAVGNSGVIALTKDTKTPFKFDITTKKLTTLGPGQLLPEKSAIPASVNNLATVVGTAWGARGRPSGFVWNGTSFSLFNAPGSTETELVSILDDSTIVGQYIAKNDYWNVFSYKDGAFYSFVLPGSQAGSNVIVVSAGSGGIVGSFYDAVSGNYEGFVHGSSGVTSAVMVPGSVGTSVSRALAGGELFGNFGRKGGLTGVRAGFHYVSGQYYELSVGNSTNTLISSVNEAGDFAGSFVDSQGIYHYFVATCPAVNHSCTN